MEKNLFSKHFLVIEKQNKNKEEVISFVREKTGVILSGEDFSLSKKEININVSSVKKSILLQKGLLDVVKQKGYRLSNL